VLVNKTWLDHYPQGVSAEVDIDPKRTLVDILQDSCGEFGPSPAYSNMDCELTYSEIDAKSRDFAAYLQNELGFAKGDRSP
jgi:long-chain acyl-CoA synthetase